MRGTFALGLTTLVLALSAAGCATATSADANGRPAPTTAPNPANGDQPQANAEDSGTRGAAADGGDIVLDAGATLEDYLAYAALHNNGLEAAFNRWKAALERVPQVSSLPDPRFTYQYFIREVETRVGPQRQSVGLSQMFPWFGKLDLAGDMAGRQAAAARQRYEQQKLDLFSRVRQTYAEYAYWNRAVAITRENRRLLAHFVDVAETRYRVAEASQADLIRAQVELGKLEDRLRTLEDLRGPIVARLNAALGRPAMAEVPVPPETPGTILQAEDEQVLAWLAEDSPELAALGHEVERQERAIELARKQYWPDFTFGVTAVQTDEALNPAARDSGKDPVAAMVSLNLPIWYHRLNAGVREARARRLAAARSQADRRDRLEAEAKMMLYELRDARRKIDLYGNALVPKARQNLRANETAYRAGSLSFLDLLDAERVLLDFQLSYARARADHAQRLARLEALVGRSLPTRNVELPEPVTEAEPPGEGPGTEGKPLVPAPVGGTPDGAGKPEQPVADLHALRDP